MDRQDQGEAAAEDKTGPMARLPDDVLADVLRRLPPRGLAACRCVCKAWLAIVDARRLLRADLLPLKLGGFFMNFNCYPISEFFAPRQPLSCGDGRSISGKHDYLPEAGCDSWGCVDDHCNGLVLVDYYNSDEIRYVLNPATRLLAPLPPCPPPPMEIKRTFQFEYLAYDPAESPYYEVVSVTRFQWVNSPGYCLYDSSKDAVDPEIEQSEWPPSVCILHVFSSRTQKWEERSFAREGDPIGTVSDMRPDSRNEQRNAVYWLGALYVHCKTDSVMRISLSSDKYHVIKPPLGIQANGDPQFYLGKSSEGIYCASVKGSCRVQVWKLVESGYQMEWMLKHDMDLSKLLRHNKLEFPRPCANYGRKIEGPWASQDINHYYYDDDHNRGQDMEPSAEEKIDWTSQASEDENDDHNRGQDMEPSVEENFDWTSQASEDENDDHNRGQDMEPSAEEKFDWTSQASEDETGDHNRGQDMEPPAEEKFDWTSQASEHEKFTWTSDDEYGDYNVGYMEILGFHPCKEIVFLSESITRGLAYHFNSSKVEVLGNLYPAGYENELGNEQVLDSSFAYTPCWLTQTPDNRE